MRKYYLSLLCLLFLSSCVPLAVVGVTGTGVSAITYGKRTENGIKGKLSDSKLFYLTKKTLFNTKIDVRNVQITIKNQELLLTGYSTENNKYEIENIANQDNRFKKIFNDISLQKAGLGRSLKDSLILSKITLKSTFGDNIKSCNYAFSVYNGIVYIIGVAENNNEFNQIVNIIKKINNVTKIISYVHIKNQQIKDY